MIEKQANSKRPGYHSGPPAKHEPVTSSLGNKNKKADREALGWINCSGPLGHHAIIFRVGGPRREQGVAEGTLQGAGYTLGIYF